MDLPNFTLVSSGVWIFGLKNFQSLQFATITAERLTPETVWGVPERRACDIEGPMTESTEAVMSTGRAQMLSACNVRDWCAAIDQADISALLLPACNRYHLLACKHRSVR